MLWNNIIESIINRNNNYASDYNNKIQIKPKKIIVKHEKTKYVRPKKNFTEMLYELYQEIQAENQHSVLKQKSLIHRALGKDVVDQVRSSLIEEL